MGERLRKIGEEWVRYSDIKIDADELLQLGLNEEGLRLLAGREQVTATEVEGIIEGSDFVRGVAEKALANREVPVEDVDRLNGIYGLGFSTTYRSNVLFPGEQTFLGYNFRHGPHDDSPSPRNTNTLYIGFLGFDEKGRLLSIDQRYPRSSMLYREDLQIGDKTTSRWVNPLAEDRRT